MKIQLVHNQKAGASGHGWQQLVGALEQAGHEVVLLPLDGEAVVSQCGLLAVAGGDGTVGTAIRRFYPALSESDIPLAIFPMGTANNIATSLGVGGDLIERAHQWHARKDQLEQRCVRFSVGNVTDKSSQQLFLESVGFGLLTRLIRIGDEQKAELGGKLDRDAELRLHKQNLQAILPTAGACHYQISIDGRDYSGDYLMVEVMNINRIGPGLEFSPQSDQGDDQFEVLLISPRDRPALSEFIEAVLAGETPTASFVRASGRDISITCPASDIHIDDKRHEGAGPQTLSIRANPKPIRVLV